MPVKTKADINRQIRDRLLQLNCWYVGDTKKFYTPNAPVVIGRWELIKGEIPGWVDIRYGKELYCYWTEEDENCPINTDGRSEEVCDRVIEYLKQEIERLL